MTSAVVGCGRIGALHAAAVRRETDVTRRWVFDLDRKMAERVARTHGAEVWQGGLSSLLARARPDVVHVCTPPASHAAIAAEALAAGAHVLVEKPMALGAAEAARLGDALRERPGALAVDHNFLFEPEMLRARRWVAEGRIGTPVALEMFYGVDSQPGGAGGPGTWTGTLPAGRFTDLLPHGLYLVRHFLGDVRSLATRTASAPSGTTSSPTELGVMLECARGLGVIRVSLGTVPWELACILRGDEGMVCVDFARQRAVLSRPGTGSRRLAQLRVAAEVGAQVALGTLARAAGKASGRLRGYPGMRALVARFYASLRAGTPPPVSWSEGAAVAVLLERIASRMAGQTGTVVPLPPRG
jgi:predicted dehydrogenase